MKFNMDINDLTWNPWHGCHKCSEGCQNCYAYFLDKRYGRDTSVVVKNKSTMNTQSKKIRMVIINYQVVHLLGFV